jgi:hypothetical protein
MIFLLSWGVSFAALWFGAHQLFYPPGDWIGAALVSFFFALGVGALRKARFARRDARLAARPEGPPKDGERVAIAGTIEPTGELLRAPLSGQPCVVYDYMISHIPDLSILDDGQRKDQTSRPSPVVDRSGMALAPSIIRSNLREVRLLAYPGLEDFPYSTLDDGKLGRARDYIAATPFTEQSVLNATEQVTKIIEDRSGNLRVDWKMTSHEVLETSRFEERIVPPGAKACVVGLYSARENGIVPQAGVGGVRLIRGTRQEALESLRGSGVAGLIFAALFIGLPGPIMFGVLTHREHFDYANDLPSVRGEKFGGFHDAVSKGNLDAVRSAIAYGVDVNATNRYGDPSLSNAANPEIATALIEAGAKIDATNREGITPVMMAASQGRADVVRLLVAKRANLNLRSRYKNMSALDYAATNGHPDIVEILRAAGARTGP